MKNVKNLIAKNKAKSKKSILKEAFLVGAFASVLAAGSTLAFAAPLPPHEKEVAPHDRYSIDRPKPPHERNLQEPRKDFSPHERNRFNEPPHAKAPHARMPHERGFNKVSRGFCPKGVREALCDLASIDKKRAALEIEFQSKEKQRDALEKYRQAGRNLRFELKNLELDLEEAKESSTQSYQNILNKIAQKEAQIRKNKDTMEQIKREFEQTRIEQIMEIFLK